ncbi:MAG: HAMP domain-containing protein [Elusimicrobia bacterium]|nr:HAMP domain-containing protein [Elusimicrobiota bacterium]
MTIKRRLIASFALMIGIIIIIAVILFVQGRIQKHYLDQSVRNYSLMTGIREIQYYLDKMSTAYEFYIILGENSEKNRFYEFSNVLKQKISEYLSQLKKFKVSQSEYNEFSGIADLSDNLILKYKNIIKIYENGSKDKAITLLEKNVLPHLDGMKEKINNIYNNKENAFKTAKQRSLVIEKTNFLISVSLSLIAIILAMILSVVLFRSISRPLSKLKEGAEKIGNGSFNYEIKITGNNELTQLAESFNKMAKNLKKSETQIIQMDRMASLGRLAGGVAHELNNPLTGVLGQSQVIYEKLPPDDPLRKTIEKIINSAERCRKITKSLLDFSRQKDYHFELTDISKLIDASLEICASDLTASKVSVVKNYDKPSSHIPKVYVSPPHIQQVFLNIITNAIQSMRGGGIFMIAVQTEHGYIKVSFKDTGEGISREDLGKIFTPFFTTKEPGKGTGLGLAISYGIVQRHNGKILISSDGEKKGATFTVKLPIKK